MPSAASYVGGGFLPCTFVKELPFAIRRKLSRALDPEGPRDWKALAAQMEVYTKRDVDSIELAIQRGNSCTIMLLEDWGSRNKTVEELAHLLSLIGNDEAMVAIRSRPDTSVEPEVDIPVVHPPEYVIPGIHPEDPRSYGQIRVDMARDELTRHPVQATGSGPMADLQQPYRPTGGAAPGSSAFDCFNQPIAEVRLASPCWPVVSGSLQTALLRAENNAVKAGMAVCDYAKLKTATGGFSSRLYVRGGNCLGSGGNGNVFFLEITRNGEKSQVACKLIHQALTDKGAIMQFKNELVVLAKIQSEANKRHLQNVGIVELKGFAVNGAYPCLIYGFMSNGSLLKAIEGKEDRLNVFTWIDRHRVAAQVAKALTHLHCGTFGSPIIHGDVKSSNILLDENMDAKLGDFGIAHIVPEDGAPEPAEPAMVAGTTVYMAPEVRRGTSAAVTTKADAYGFGIVLLELLTGLSAYDKQRPENLEDLKSYVLDRALVLDDMVKGAYYNTGEVWPEVLYQPLYRVARSCLENYPSRRSSVQEVTEELDRLKQGSLRSTGASGYTHVL